MAVGFKYGVYIPDHGTNRVVRVEADRFAAGDFAWTAPAAGEVATGYGSLRPRHVLGREASTGKRGRAIVPDVGSDIWNGTATSFILKDDDGVTHTMAITGYVGEASSITP